MHGPPIRRPRLRDLPSSGRPWLAAAGIVAGALFLATLVRGMRWGIYMGPSRAPTPVDLPWISFGRNGAFAVFCVAVTACTLWWDRHSERRYEPLSLVALCVCVLGHGQAVRAGEYLTFHFAAWPLNLVPVAIGTLLVAAGLGALSWLRILLYKTPFRGRMFATCALVCSPCTAFIVHTFLFDNRLTPLEEAGVELPTAHHSRNARSVRLQGFEHITISSEGTVVSKPLEEIARAMPQGEGAANDPVILTADRRAPWSSVRPVFADLEEVGIWKVVLDTRWEEPPGRTLIRTYMWLTDEPVTGVTHVLRVTPDGFELDGRRWTNERELMAAVDEVHGDRGELLLHIDPAPDTPWQQVVWAVSAALRSFEEVCIGRFRMSLYS